LRISDAKRVYRVVKLDQTSTGAYTRTMSNTAKEIEVFETTETEGLEDLFANQDASNELEFANRTNQAANYTTVEHAASLLGISKRAVQKRLRKGTLDGQKVTTNTGNRWRVSLDALGVANQTNQGASNELEFANQTNQGASNELEFANQTNQGASSEPEFANQTKPDLPEELEVIQDDYRTLDLDDFKSNLIAELQAKLDERDNKLEGANYRIGYLEGQLTVKDEQIKLLADHQNQGTAWQKFLKWFFGQ